MIKQINSLESSLELQLFERTHRGLLVTESGKTLYQDAKYLIQYSKDSVFRAKEAVGVQKEKILAGLTVENRRSIDDHNRLWSGGFLMMLMN